jgi:hypothetical protein
VVNDNSPWTSRFSRRGAGTEQGVTEEEAIKDGMVERSSKLVEEGAEVYAKAQVTGGRPDFQQILRLALVSRKRHFGRSIL